MAVYTVHEPPLTRSDARRGPERFVFVRDGFYFWAFVLAPLWMLYRRLWLGFLAYCVVALAIGFGLKALGVSNVAMFVVQLMISALVGLEASTLLRWKLRLWGWHEAGLVSGRKLEAAEQRFFDQWTGEAERAMSPVPAAAVSPAPAHHAPRSNSDIVGLFPEPGATR